MKFLAVVLAAFVLASCGSGTPSMVSRKPVTVEGAIQEQQNTLARMDIDVLRIQVDGTTVRIIAAWTRPQVLKVVQSNALLIHLWGDLGITRVVMENPNGRHWECRRRANDPDKWDC
jgi:hypothetical protein